MSQELFGSTGRVLITDYDGTITEHDFYDLILERHAPPHGLAVWDAYLAGQVPLFVALQRIFATLPGGEAEAVELAHAADVDPQFGDAIDRLCAGGWSVLIVSAGCRWYIEQILRDRGLSVPVIANPGQLAPEGGLAMHRDTESVYYSEQTGVDKAAVVRSALAAGYEVAFAGDSQPDLAAARLAPGERRFARRWLATAFDRLGEPYHRIAKWSDIARILIDSNVA